MLVVGLGGGGLPQFIRDFVPSVHVKVVELDPAVLEVAKTWFGFQPDDRLEVILGDGLEHISTLESKGEIFYTVHGNMLLNVFGNILNMYVLKKINKCIMLIL